ncbi:FAD-linked oxidase C-terminal domain-containing protein [uncultured Maritimibacter sp.]|uniref:FAD-binding oxidoreductase n=1 Tax=uncultured Maritimibacter sp. TaxID=991866 RepID=UPI0026147A9D|nr:FAD-linked oxidase C-terminal domain-containing protein [uncultured Maritimibacter sp.]
MLETIVAHGNFLTLDASLPLSRIADFLDKAAPLTQEAGLKPLLIAHLGDGNVQYAVVAGAQPWDADRVAAFTRRMVALLTDFSSSFSAEHGIGRAKVATLAREKQPAQYRLMQTIRHGIDPAGRLSPGLLLEAAE